MRTDSLRGTCDCGPNPAVIRAAGCQVHGMRALREAAGAHVGAYMRGDKLGPTVAALAKAAGLKGQGEAP